MATSTTYLSLIKPELTDTTKIREDFNLNMDTIDGRFSVTYMAVQDKSSVTITGGTITGITDLAVADGGTGASTLTDGGVLLGSGTGAITAMAVLADGQMIVGNGTTDPVAESGATLRTSIGCAATAQTFYIGTTQVAINRSSAALTLAGITLTTPDIGTPSAGVLTNCTFPTLNQNTTGSAATLTTARTIGGVSFNGSANITVASATGGFTISGGNLALSSNSITMSGSIGVTGTRVTKLWTADLECTNDITINGTALASIYANLGANTDITSILNTALYVGRDADNQIKFATDNTIVFRLAGSDGAAFISTGELDMDAHSVGFTLQTLTGDGTDDIDWKLGNKMKLTLPSGDETLTFTAPTNPGNLTLHIVQDGVGGRDVTFPVAVKWLGTEPTWSDGGAGKTIVMSMWYDGTNYWSQGTSWES